MRLTYPFDLPILPYSFDAMCPVMSEWTMQTHYEKNHANYVKKTNELLKSQKKLQKSSLALLLTQAKGPLFDMAAQHFNHVFWWYTLKPFSEQAPEPKGKILHMMMRDFGSVANWRQAFIAEGLKRFGSGWCWLIVDDDGKLKNVTTPNAQIPNFFKGKQPLIVCDLWEHAYFCDYTIDRKAFMGGFMQCINWDMANFRLSGQDKLFKLY